MSTAVVFVGGPHRPRHDVARHLVGIDVDMVIAVDSGLHLAQGTVDRIDLVIGDMDSVDPAQLDAAARTGARILRHPVDKDATDLELALDEVVRAGCTTALVLGADGGRMDHLLGAALLVGSPRFASVQIDAWFGGARLLPVHGHRSVTGRSGLVVSLIPVHGPVAGVRTSGLRWTLHDERLDAGTSRGLSNEFLDDVADITVSEGVLVVVIPEEESPCTP